MPYDILIGLIVSLSVISFLLGRHFTAVPVVQTDDQLTRYLVDGTATGLPPVVANDVTRLTFVQRVITPMTHGLLSWLGGLAPQHNVDALDKRLETAGRPSGLNVLNFLGLKFILAPMLALGGLMLGRGLLHQPLALGLLTTAAFGAIGFFLPDAMLEVQIAGRKRAIIRALPDALDMIVVCVEAGQGLDQALKRVGARWRNPLAEEFNRILAEIALGRTRREALSAASERIQLADVSSLFSAIMQADQLGIGIRQVLQAQAAQLRTVRRQHAEGLAREAAIKLLFPLVFLIFPSMFAVLLGPAIPMLLRTFVR